ncbi:alpha/beta fold hydrolase [Pinirhizobacter sp.]|jgi:putative redox protein|uniref:bifunctional alpha/beta hydrolase/OsmC family protein n=1 Tax=Pinirhizobacter sp. TaxID=2950432 RepID=UPI002F4029A6
MSHQDFSFTNLKGERLAGKLERPDEPVRGWAVFAHCFACSKDSLAGVYITRALARAGIGTLRFDFAGVGASEGAPFAGGVEGDVQDVICAAEAMTKAGMAPTLLVGHSLGGAAVIAATGAIGSVRAVASINAPFHKAVNGLACPLLVMHAPDDPHVAISQGEEIFAAARYPKSFVALDGADHYLKDRSQTTYIATVLTAWASRYLEPVAETRALGQDGDVLAEETGAGLFQLAMRAGGIRFLADEPVSVGGLGSGPTPYDLVCAGLAACTTMTVRLYARKKGLPITHIRTAVGHVKDIVQPRPDLFSRTVCFEGDITDEQRARVMEIADRCPVDITLSSGARIQTRFGAPPAGADPVDAHAEEMVETVEFPGEDG